MFEGFDMNKMSAMMGDMQNRVKELEEKAKEIELTAKSGGGLVKVTMNGLGEVVDVTIDDSLLHDKSSLQILLMSAINDANKMVEDNRKSQAMGMMGGMNPFKI
jgi:DNA-binding YbaB/EbfC family protein